MIKFGWTNPFPFRFGGGTSTKEVVREAILHQLKPFLDPDPSTENYAETAGEAALIALIWSCNKRLSNQANPSKMLENLAVWEEATNLRPSNEDTMPERRRRLAAKMSSQVNNSIDYIEQVASKFMGANYEQLIKVDASDVVSYWPGVNPGPPGYEWCSNYAHIAIQVNKNGVTDTQWTDKVDRLVQHLQRFLPSWQTFEVGTGDSFVAAVGILGEALV